MSFYQIYLRDVQVEASIGIHDFERAAKQELLISAVILLKEKVLLADNINSVVDYDFVRDLIINQSALKHWELQESLCASIAEKCLSKDDVLGAIIRTEKTSVYADAAAVGCRIAKISDELPQDFNWWTIVV